ncbi:hypothetical protein F4808DRAFT_469568 [Astrocystis sublimbata]|nr:hypothetical protein F4808DRAFT_469568 [Astrocystis sublimbata]
MSQLPVTSHTLERRVPEWNAGTTSSDNKFPGNAVPHDNEQSIKFILSFNWVLLAEGVASFYESLYQCDKNLELQYDPVNYCFRVKCLSGDEVSIVTLVKQILDELTKKETQKGLDTSTKIASFKRWQTQISQTPQKIVIPEKYSYPRDVALCSICATWCVADDLFSKGVTASKLLPESALSKLQELTNTVLVTSSDRKTVYIGAPGTEPVAKIKQKLDTLANFFALASKNTTQVVGIFLYNEGDKAAVGEYRRVADGNDRLLRTYILDRFDWPHTSHRYPTIFQRSVLVRLNPNNEPWQDGRSLSSTVQPIVKNGSETEKFGAFTQENWNYPAKDSVLAPESDISLKPLGLVTQPSMFTPEIESWVSSISSLQNEDLASNIVHENVEVGDTDSQQPGVELTAILPANNQMRSLHEGSRASTSEDRPENGDFTPSVQQEPTAHERMSRHEDISKPNVPLANGSQEHQNSPRKLPANGCLPLTDNMHCLPNENDPFQHLIGEFRRIAGRPVRGIGGDPIDEPNMNAALSACDIAGEPQITNRREKDTRSYHLTMRQKAGAPRNVDFVFPEFDPEMMPSINESLTKLMAPLRMWAGMIDLEIELGRFYFLNVQASRIQQPGDIDDDKHYKIRDIQNELNKRHTADDKLCFTRILSSLGADANYIARISDHDGNQMWRRPTDGRTSTYEFTCRAGAVGGTEFHFVVEINAKTFTSRVKEFKPIQNSFAVSCTKHVWDFRLVLSKSPNIIDVCEQFARDLVGSLQVRPNNDLIPELEVSYDKGCGIQILAVRTRNKACCVSERNIKVRKSTQAHPTTEVQRLYVSEIWEMDRLDIIDDERRVQLKFARFKQDDEHPSMPSMWYEATLKSDTLTKAFEQNQSLELGDEVEWTSENLLGSGAVEELIRKAGVMVKKMDAVGYWNDNHQADLLGEVKRSARGQEVPIFW